MTSMVYGPMILTTPTLCGSVHQDPAAVVACMVLLEETHFYCAFLPIFMKMGAGVTGLQPKDIILFVKV